MQAPYAYLRRFPIDLRCPVRPELPATIDAGTQVRIGHDTWFVSSREARRELESDPLHFVEVLTDPVSGERFRPGPDSPRTDFRGRPYYFASDRTHGLFLTHPPDYAEPRRRMKRG